MKTTMFSDLSMRVSKRTNVLGNMKDVGTPCLARSRPLTTAKLPPPPWPIILEKAMDTEEAQRQRTKSRTRIIRAHIGCVWDTVVVVCELHSVTVS
jgi:hypothetical protein